MQTFSWNEICEFYLFIKMTRILPNFSDDEDLIETMNPCLLK